MKTITEYQPLIFSKILGQADPRKTPKINGILTAVEVAGGFWLMADTGLVPWQWQFWLVFAPFFVAGELALRALNARRVHAPRKSFVRPMTPEDELSGVSCSELVPYPH